MTEVRASSRKLFPCRRLPLTTPSNAPRTGFDAKEAGVRYGGHLTGWDLAPATAVIGLGQGMALPSLIGAALSHVPSERAGAAAGILTTAQQFGVASGVAVIGAVFYTRLGITRASSISAVELAMAVNAVVVLAAAALTLLLPRQSPARTPAPAGRPVPAREEAGAEYSAGASH